MTEAQRDELKTLCQKADVPDKTGELLTQEGAQHFIDELKKQIGKEPLKATPVVLFVVIGSWTVQWELLATCRRRADRGAGDGLSEGQRQSVNKYGVGCELWPEPFPETAEALDAYSLMSETLPTAAEVTSIAPSATPTRTSVRIHMRCRIDARCRIDRIFINHRWRRRYNDRPANHDNGSRLLDNDRRRRPVLVRMSFPP